MPLIGLEGVAAALEGTAAAGLLRVHTYILLEGPDQVPAAVVNPSELCHAGLRQQQFSNSCPAIMWSVLVLHTDMHWKPSVSWADIIAKPALPLP